MNLKKLFCFGLIVILSVFNYLTSFSNDKGIKVLNNVIEAVNADIKSININANGKISNDFLNRNDLINLKNKIIKELNDIYIDLDKYSTKIYETNNKVELIFNSKEKKNDLLNLILISYKDNLNDFKQTLLIFDITYNNKKVDINNVYNKIKEIYNKFNGETKITTCYTASFNGNLDSETKYLKLSKIINLLNFNKKEGIKNNEILSITGYSSNFDDFIFSGRKKINVNIAMKYNELEDKTYILLATPLINTEY